MVCLTIPGLCCSGEDHWQSRWEATRGDCHRVELGRWDDPCREQWVARLDAAITAAPRRPILVAHSLGCLVVRWWTQRHPRVAADRVAGALLVAPPDVDRADADARIGRFAPTPCGPLPFPALLVASHDDAYATFDRSRAMAADWRAQLVDLGAAGHINAQSNLGEWRFGQQLLDRLIAAG